MSIKTFLDNAWLENHEALSKTVSSCSNCQSPFEEWEHSDVSTCLKCGTVIARCLDLTAEYRYFSQDDRGGGDPCRVGAPQDNRFPESSLGTVICLVEAINAAREWVRKPHQNPLNHRFIFCPHFSQNLVFITIFTKHKVLYF